MREAWRLNCGGLRDKLQLQSKIMYIGLYYQANGIESYQIIETKIKKLIQRLIKHHEETCS